MRVFVLTLLMALGLGTCAWGLASLIFLSQIYRGADLAVTETPATFEAWLAGELRAEGAHPAQLSDRIARRLLVMPLEKRRIAANAMMRRAFWEALSDEGGSPRVAQREVRDGILLALQSAPTSGDLYLTAAWLETATDGFGSRGRELLKASHVFAPRELPLIRGRLTFAALVWPLLGSSERGALKADLAIYREIEPQRAEELAAQLKAQGVVIE